MREFVYFSRHAWTSGNFKDLMEAGRMDIVCHVIINAFFLSQKLRDDVALHLIFYGPPDPPKHIIMKPSKNITEGGIDISKKDISGLIKRILFKYKDREGKLKEVFPGYFAEKKSLLKVISNMIKEGKEVYILDKDGEDIRKINFGGDPAFVLADHSGFPQKELKRLKAVCKTVSIGKKMYFASQVMTIVNNEIDRRES